MEFEVVALPEEFAFLLFLQGTAFLALLGRLALGLGEAPMDGAAIFELDFSPFSIPASSISNSARAAVVAPTISPAEASAETATDSAKRCAPRSKF